ncbi:MAG TPA: hypothetical protein VF586_11575 [Pyrinomonadaceae bacterium]|jgi:hypothetical protein
MKRYNVIVLGARGSGKTVFLASLFRKLSVAGEYGFFLSTNMRQQKQLTAVYNMVATGDRWPDATQLEELSDWEFTCRVVSPSAKIYDAFEIVYLDYSGGRLTDVTAGRESDKFESRLNNADCLLGLIDGQKLLDFMNGVDKDGKFQYTELASVFNLLNRSANPVHIVISKWDLLEGHFSLEQIRQKLLKDDLFLNLARTKSRLRTPLRLIPVSSVGSGFAVKEADGVMRKVPGATPRPFQVEMPFALVLPDKIKTEIERIVREKNQLSRAPAPMPAALTLWERIGRVFGGVVRTVREFLPEKLQYTEKLLQKIAERAERGAQLKDDEYRRITAERQKELQASLANVSDEESALEHSVHSFLELERRLQYTFPASYLDLPADVTI